MPSVIDPNFIVDGQPVAKADLRQTLSTIKQEIEHGGFFTAAAGGSELSVADALAGQWVDVRAFGAVGDGVTDNTTALQTAIDSGFPLYFPPGTYRVTAPLTYAGSVRMKGTAATGGGVPSTPGYSRIIGNFTEPLIHTAGFRITHDDIRAENAAVIRNGLDSSGTGKYFHAEDMVFSAEHPLGCCIQGYNLGPGTLFLRCTFGSDYRGLVLSQAFDSIVQSCWFISNHFGVHTDSIATGLYEKAHMFWGGASIYGCAFQGGGSACTLNGPAQNMHNCRLEVNGYGLRCGTSFSLEADADAWGGVRPHSTALVSGISFESNYRNFNVVQSAKATYENISIQGGTNGKGPDGIADYGVLLEAGDAVTSSARNIHVGGRFHRFPFRNLGRYAIAGVTTAWTGGSTEIAATPLLASGATPFGDDDRAYNLERYPAVDGRLITAHSDLHLRGLKGLNILDGAQPNNLGGIETVSTSATTHEVTFPAEVSALFNGNPSASGSGSSLGSGTYYYAVTAIGPRGESGKGDYTNTDGNTHLNYRSVEVTAGQEVSLAAHGVGRTDIRFRWYRGTAPDQFDGYYETTAASYTDTGAAFHGYGHPPYFTSVPSRAEPDANYGIVATPSWPTTVAVTSKTSTGFTLEFGTAAPAGATVQWLLFRP